MTTYYKAVRPNGNSFHDPSFAWATEPGGVTRHPTHGKTGNTSTAAGYLSVSTTPTDCTGMHWPCRLLEVEPVGDVFAPNATGLPNKCAALEFRTVRELAATVVFGPQGVQVAVLIDRAGLLTSDEVDRLAAAWDAAWDAAWAAAWVAAGAAYRHAAWDAAWAAAGAAAWDATRDAAGALICRDLIGQTFTQAHYDTLTGPWRTVVGPIHPDDDALEEDK